MSDARHPRLTCLRCRREFGRSEDFDAAVAALLRTAGRVPPDATARAARQVAEEMQRRGPVGVCGPCAAEMERHYADPGPVPGGTLAVILRWHWAAIARAVAEANDPDIRAVLRGKGRGALPGRRFLIKARDPLVAALRRVGSPACCPRLDGDEPGCPFLLYSLDPDTGEVCCSEADHAAVLNAGGVVSAFAYAPDGSPLPGRA